MASSTLSTTCKILFSKYSGAGNDFILVDDRSSLFPADDKNFIRQICHRQHGIGADGLILLQNSTKANFRFRIFNADGSEAEMCGNGVRCFAKFTQELGFKNDSFMLETMQRILQVSFIGSKVAVDMGTATNIHWDIKLQLKTGEKLLHFLDTGVPHAVLFVESLNTFDVVNAGKEIRFHPLFQPKGTNANFVEITNQNKLHIRTYERGVEGETLACGTGVTAAALTAAHIYNLPSPINVQTHSQETLTISFKKENNAFSQVIMTGNAQLIFQGNIPCK
ncbi:MAG: diaminopimelate epimerase [Chlamydiales bacterium]|nr:diaminopimelate epimerase [Chlamydiales bacterium]